MSKPSLLPYILPTLFSSKDFMVDMGEAQFYVEPRSDHLFILWETWVNKDYYPEIEVSDIKNIIDIGAHIGDFTLWAHKHYHPDRLVAIEPSANLYALLKKNVKLNNPGDSVSIRNAAIFHKDTTVRVNKGASSALNHVSESADGTTEAITLDRLASDSSMQVVDLLKIDIEGGEQHLMTPENEAFFKTRVRYLFMEAHDLHGNRKEHAGEYLRDLGFEVMEQAIPWFFGIHRIQAINRNLVSKVAS